VAKRVPDCIVVPAIGFKMPDPLQRALARPDVRDATVVLRRWAEQGALMSAACIGTFVLAESGLLDHRHATTTWWLAPLFRTRYPTVQLDESHMLVKSGRVVTAGAALSHMDLALWLIRQQSPKLAAVTAKYLIVDSRPSQSAYVLTDHLIHSDPLVERFERGPARGWRTGFPWTKRRKPSPPASERLPVVCTQSWGSRPSPTFKVCGWNARCTC
jgi:transcriptional regulator GlxA family with amidase domain